MTKEEIHAVTSWMGKRGYEIRVQRLGMEKVREIARQNGKKGGRPRKREKTS